MKCEKCGSEMKFQYIVHTSDPVKYGYECPKCGNVQYSFTSDITTKAIRQGVIRGLEERRQRAEKEAIEALIKLVDAITAERDYYRDRIEEL